MFGLAVLMAIGSHFLEKRRQRRIARGRPPMSRADFLDRLAAAGASEAISEFVLAEMVDYYHEPLSPYPDDRFFTTLRIDPGDLEDIAIRFCERFSLPLPSVEDPERLPDDPSLEELALCLERYAQTPR